MEHYQSTATQTRTAAGEVDRGLQNFMSLVYLQMGVGMLVTAVVAMVIGLNDELLAFFRDPEGGPTTLGLITALAPIGLILVMGFLSERVSAATMAGIFQVFSALMGASSAFIFSAYTGHSIASVFLTTMIMFLGLSLWGYTTKRDMSGLGSFFLMGLIGLIAAMVINMFMGSAAIQFAISVIGVLLFAGLTAYDTQTTKRFYLEGGRNMPREDVMKASTMAAVSLYLDLLNMFHFMLAIFGSRD